MCGGVVGLLASLNSSLEAGLSKTLEKTWFSTALGTLGAIGGKVFSRTREGRACLTPATHMSEASGHAPRPDAAGVYAIEAHAAPLVPAQRAPEARGLPSAEGGLPPRLGDPPPPLAGSLHPRVEAALAQGRSLERAGELAHNVAQHRRISALFCRFILTLCLSELPAAAAGSNAARSPPPSEMLSMRFPTLQPRRWRQACPAQVSLPCTGILSVHVVACSAGPASREGWVQSASGWGGA